jgi:hypothetical protein
MNAFANPNEASPYEFPEFPAPEKQQLDLSLLESASSTFKDFQQSLSEPQEAVVTVVQTAVFQDFKAVLQPNQA